MRIYKVRAVVREKVTEYPRMDRIIERLEKEKENSKGRDINSFIRSKYKINRVVEGQAIKEISIDDIINKYKEWKEIIKDLLEELRKEDNIKAEIIDSKFTGGSFEEISEELFISKETARKYFNEFILEVCIMAVKKNLIEIE